MNSVLKSIRYFTIIITKKNPSVDKQIIEIPNDNLSLISKQ